ncbi:phosphopantetheine-binding protein [Rhodococcus sp. NPDC080181]|uniref:acyl carrier protein n=1 Tax=Rhodococcus sp. NPDC080181 TaxID=3155292 RepID=UPI00344E3C65
MTVSSSSTTEAWVLETCISLGLPITETANDIFAVGATSLTALKLIARAEDAFGEDALPPDDLFERPTIAEIAATIARSTTRLDSSDSL